MVVDLSFKQRGTCCQTRHGAAGAFLSLSVLLHAPRSRRHIYGGKFGICATPEAQSARESTQLKNLQPLPAHEVCGARSARRPQAQELAHDNLRKRIRPTNKKQLKKRPKSCPFRFLFGRRKGTPPSVSSSHIHPSCVRLYSPTRASASAISRFASSRLYTVEPLAQACPPP